MALELKREMIPAVPARPARPGRVVAAKDGVQIQWDEEGPSGIHCYPKSWHSATGRLGIQEFRQCASMMNEIADRLEAEQ